MKNKLKAKSAAQEKHVYLHLHRKMTAARELKLLKAASAKAIARQGERVALNVFHFAVKSTPAYQKLLHKHNIRPSEIRTIADFQRLPLLSKDSYLRAHEYRDLFPYRNIPAATTIAATSGSTGEPFFFPRDEAHDRYYERAAELFLRNQFHIHERSTLGIIGFGLGIWIGGIFTYKNFNALAAKGRYPLTLIPVGVQKELFLKSFKKFADSYEQVLLMGYPPFIKDLLDSGAPYGINWRKHRIGIITATEGFSEAFREYLARKAGIDDRLSRIVNMYGTVEQGTLAHETSFTNLIRSIAAKNSTVFNAIFPGATALPTLAQYHPNMIHFESVDGEVVATSYSSSIPLIRYRFADLGGVIPFDETVAKLEQSGIDIMAEARRHGIAESIIKLPFVYVYARSDFVTVFRGANIYPNEVRTALDRKEFRPFLTGKMTMVRGEDDQLDSWLTINIELKPGVRGSARLSRDITRAVIDELTSCNSEFANNYRGQPEKNTPRVTLWPYQHPAFFAASGKHPWVKKN